MGRFGVLASLLLAVGLNVQQAAAQSGTPAVYKDPATGIIFDTWSVPNRNTGGGASGTYGGLKFGLALPSNALTTKANEFVGLLECPKNSTTLTGYCGISLGGPMTNSLLLTAWPAGTDVLTSFRFATGYVEPDLYTGDAKLTQVSSNINSTHYSVIFRCQNCLAWNQGGTTGGPDTSSGGLVLGWANSFKPPTDASCANTARFGQHDNNQGIWGAQLDSNVANPSYTQWAALATKTVTGSCGGGTAPPTSTSTSVPPPTGVPVPNKQYDYIIVGGGAGGIPMADKLSEAGKKVLLIEKGPASTGRWAGNAKPAWNTPPWLEGTGLTRFDVPGLCNEIWVDSAGIACTDVDRMAGCVLGGGVAINAGLWWKPNTVDWDYNFPAGWKASDMVGATNRVFSRIPGTDTPSMDGKRYLQQGFEALATGLKAGGWSEVTANNAPNQKNRTYSHSPFMFSNGERGGPLATYLVSASKRSNFDMWLNTAVKRVVRTGGHVTGLEVEAFRTGGYGGTINLTPGSGRVILSAGVFGSSKILFRSGIGPQDQLEVVKGSADGSTMISQDNWIPLPVGKNLEDHTNTDLVISHPDVVFYDFYQAFDEPIVGDKTAYLSKRSGILAQAAPNIGPVMWDSIKTTTDGVERQLQWTARVEGSLGAENGKTMTLSQYLGRGAKSRGRLTITSSLSMTVSELPYLTDKGDVQAVIQGIKNLQAALNKVPNLTWVAPAPGQSAEDYVNQYVVSSNRGANHWIGSAKIGPDDGRTKSGTAVVDVNTQVYGTDNLFVVDAGIFPGHITTNPSSYITIASERAAERILALAPAAPRNAFDQCGGLNYSGSFQCKSGTTCKKQNDYYWQCLA